jgi:hypothetical protein
MRDHRYLRSSYVLGLAALLCLTMGAWSAQVRVATYNIQSVPQYRRNHRCRATWAEPGGDGAGGPSVDDGLAAAKPREVTCGCSRFRSSTPTTRTEYPRPKRPAQSEFR